MNNYYNPYNRIHFYYSYLNSMKALLAIEKESITNRYYRCFIHYRNSCTSWWNNVI